METQNIAQYATQRLQKPINSGFSASSTAEDVLKGIDLTGKNVIVTGGYAGIGLETVRVLHNAGAHITVPARDYAKAHNALKDFANVQIEKMDLLDLPSIDAFAEKFIATGKPLHILINNAAVMASPLSYDALGNESQFSTNHLGHFHLTNKLWPALQKANGTRVVEVASWGHRHTPVIFNDMNYKTREYQPWVAYGQSKTANILFALALDERGQKHNVRAFSIHPGVIVSTDLKRHISVEELKKANAIDENGEPILDPSKQRKNVAQGAATTVWCATSPQLNGMGGLYCENADVSPLIVDENVIEGNATREVGAVPQGVMPYAVDPAAAERLWRLSEQLTQTKFTIL
jgi:NAD(P)-dependent dehydrogenase (short-subunit alcohol dehydrogenase family)